MTLYTNHCFCSDSNWGGHYDCRYILGINKGDELKRIEFDPRNPSMDWKNVLVETKFFDKEGYAEFIKENPKSDKEKSKSFFNKRTYRLKDEVVKWLEKNVKDRDGEENSKGWAVGTDMYNHNALVKFNIFFHRKNDALAFIKKWGEFPKPTSYFNYFSGKRQQLNLKTMTLKSVDKIDYNF